MKCIQQIVTLKSGVSKSKLENLPGILPRYLLKAHYLTLMEFFFY